jgi:FtsZ-interacting cell division protein ZipA
MKFSERSNTEKAFIIIIIIAVAGIILRWGFVKSEISRSLKFFDKNKTEQTAE